MLLTIKIAHEIVLLMFVKCNIELIVLKTVDETIATGCF